MKLFKKICEVFYIVIIMAVCTVPIVGMIFGWGSKSTENRILNELPELFIVTEDSTELNTKFTAELGDYYSENFGFRQELVTANSVLNEKLFFRAANEKVTLGKNSWYYFNETLDDYTGRSNLSERGIYRLKKTLDLINEYAEESNIEMLFFSAPNKNSIYPENMPWNIRKSKQPSNLDRLNKILSDSDYYLNIKDDLQELANDKTRNIYLKHDSHWNNLGALAAYNAIQDNLKSRIENFDYMPVSSTDITEVECSGDLTNMLYPSLDKTDVQYDLGIPMKFSSEQPLTNLMANEINTYCQGRYYTAICYRDSFFNSMININSNAFAKVRYTRTFPYDITAAKSGNFNIAILEIAERNIPTLLNEAPLMDAIRKSAPKSTQKVAAEQYCEFTDDGEFFKFSGELGDWAELDVQSNIYIELRSSSGKSYYYEAFPILSGNATGDNGFSVRITKYGLANDDYEIFIHVGSKESTKYTELKVN